MLLQGNTSQVRNVQQDIMKVEGNVELTEQKSRKNRKEAKKAKKKQNNNKQKKHAIKTPLIGLKAKFKDLHLNLLDGVGVSRNSLCVFLIGRLGFINPRRACAARVTVVVCLFVCRRLFSHYRLRGGL